MMKAISLTIAVVSACCFGFAGPMARFLGEAGLTPMAAVWVRMAGAGLVLLSVLAVFRPRALRVPRRRLPFFVAYSVVAVGGVQGLFFLAITRLPVGVALLIEFTSPVLVVLWVRLVQRVRLPRSAYLGALVAVAGMAIVVQVWQGLRLDAVGLLLAFGAAACCAGYFLMSDSFGDDVDMLGLIGWGMLGASAVLLPLARPWDLPWSAFTRTAELGGHVLPVAGAAAWMVLVATVTAYVTGVTAVRRLSAAVGSTVASLEVIAGALIAWVLLGERLSMAQITGGAVVLVGAMLAQSATVRRSPADHRVAIEQPVNV